MRRRERRLSASEAALWRAVTDKVTPIQTRAPVPAEPTIAAPPALPTPKRRGRAPGPPPASVPPTPAPRLGAGDPKEARRIARGRREIDASLDLHGMTQDEAYARLTRFVQFGDAQGFRTLLIVTGKGRGEARVPFAEAPRGILRERFLDWVERPPLSDRIASVRGAHPRHGGRGAFYVMLRRARP